MEKYLPIGSVVLLSNAKKRVMVIGYKPMMENNGEKIEYDYGGCLFPEGVLESNQTLVFNHDQIEYVFYYGLEDDEYKEFMIQFKEMIEDNDNDSNIDIPIFAESQENKTIETFNVEEL